MNIKTSTLNGDKRSRALRTCDAILFAEVPTCERMGLLPPTFSKDEADREEFFHPEITLQRCAGLPDWGLAEDPGDEETGQSRVELTESAILATVQEMHRSFDHTGPLSARLRMRTQKACREELAQLRTELLEHQKQT